MKKDDESGGMWCLVMFDLPVGTKTERREATQFRNMLLDMGYMMVQFSIYVRYTPTQSGNRSTVRMIKEHLPAGGKVRIDTVSNAYCCACSRDKHTELKHSLSQSYSAGNN